MSDPAGHDDPECARDVRALTGSLLLGVVLGGAIGVTRYGLFTMGNVAMVGLGVIVSVSLHALVVALRPARDSKPAE